MTESEQHDPFRIASLSGDLPGAAEGSTRVAVEPAGFPDLGGQASTGAGAQVAPFDGAGIRLLSDIPLEVTVELGRTVLTVRELLSLRPGSVVELAGAAGAVDVVVNGRLVARGDVVVVDDSFGVRVTEIIDPGASDSNGGSNGGSNGRPGGPQVS